MDRLWRKDLTGRANDESGIPEALGGVTSDAGKASLEAGATSIGAGSGSAGVRTAAVPGEELKIGST